MNRPKARATRHLGPLLPGFRAAEKSVSRLAPHSHRVAPPLIAVERCCSYERTPVPRASTNRPENDHRSIPTMTAGTPPFGAKCGSSVRQAWSRRVRSLT